MRQTHSGEFCAKKAVNSNRVVCCDLDPSRELRCVVFSKQALSKLISKFATCKVDYAKVGHEGGSNVFNFIAALGLL